MDQTPPPPTGPPDVRLPAECLGALARAARADSGQTAVALREAGRRSGSAIASELARRTDPGSVTMEAFWDAVREELEARGLGEARYALLAPGVAEVRWRDGPETSAGDADQAVGAGGCPFSTGVLAGLLGEIAGAPVAVMEVACRARGTDACRYLVGDAERLRAVRRAIRSGSSVEEAAGAA